MTVLQRLLAFLRYLHSTENFLTESTSARLLILENESVLMSGDSSNIYKNTNPVMWSLITSPAERWSLILNTN